MNASPYSSRSPHLASTPAAAHDAISTSSSTLVNADLEEDTVRRRRRQKVANTPTLHVLDEETSANHAMKRGLFTSEGWLKADARPSQTSQTAKMEYPDDHRCSDQDTAGGLCSCAQDASPDSVSSSSRGGEDTDGDRQSNEKRDANYDQQLLAARKRKMLSEAASGSALHPVRGRATGKEGKGDDAALGKHHGAIDRLGHRSRNLHSDPVLVPRPTTSGAHVSSSSEDDEWMKPVPSRRWASSPTLPASKAPYQPAESSLTVSATRTGALGETGRGSRGSNALSTSRSSSANAVPPSAARRSISNVFEKLLKEEEDRREEERMRKEAARERRREEKKRRETDSRNGWSTAYDARWTGVESQEQPSSEIGSFGQERESLVSSALEESSRAQLDVNRLERLSRIPSHSSPVRTLAPKPSPLKPAAESYRARLEALRLASQEEEGEEEGLQEAMLPREQTSTPMMQKRDATKEVDSITRFSFPNKAPTTDASRESDQYPSPNPSHSSPRSSSVQGEASSPASPRRNSHRRTGNREGVVGVISLSANSPSLHQSQVQDRVQSLFGSPLVGAEESEKDEEKVDDRQLSQPSLRRVTFSPQPEVIESVVEEAADEDDASEELSEAEEGHSEEEMPSIAETEEPRIDLDIIKETVESEPSRTSPSRPLSGTPLRRTFASPMFPGTYFSPSMPQPSPSTSYSRHVLRPRQERQGEGLKESAFARSPSPTRRTWSSPLHHSIGPPLSRSSSANLSVSEHSRSGELMVVEEDEGGEDHVTIGSDFQGQAPLQSTPPRHGSVIKAEVDAKMEADLSVLSDDSILQTLKQMEAVLRKVEEVNEGASLQNDTAALSTRMLEADSKQETGALQGRHSHHADVDQSEGAQMSDVYEEKLGSIRKRLQWLASTGTAVPKRQGGQSCKALLFTLFLQIGFACLLVMAAEARARQLFLTTYHDPFQPFDSLDLSTSTFILAPLLQKWNLTPLGDRDGSVQAGWSWTILSQALRGSDHRKIWTMLTLKAASLLNLDGDDVFQVGRFVPT